MISDSELETLRANPRFLIRELQARGVDVSMLDFQRQVFLAVRGTHREWLVETFSSLLPAPLAMLANDKYVVKSLLEGAGISVADGNRFTSSQINEAMMYAAFLGFPVVLKPADSSQGRGVRVGLTSMAEVEAAADETCRHPQSSGLFMVERQHAGVELRLFVARDGRYAAVRRTPASVVGDGVHDIKALAERETDRRMNPRRGCEGPLHITELVARHLAASERTVDDVPPAGERVFLRGYVEAEGASVDDVTEDVHPSLVEVGVRALDAVGGLAFAGLDILVEAPSDRQVAGSYQVLELNAHPALGVHLAPGTGKRRNVAAVFADFLFPETATSVTAGFAIRPIA